MKLIRFTQCQWRANRGNCIGQLAKYACSKKTILYHRGFSCLNCFLNDLTVIHFLVYYVGLVYVREKGFA